MKKKWSIHSNITLEGLPKGIGNLSTRKKSCVRLRKTKFMIQSMKGGNLQAEISDYNNKQAQNNNHIII